MKSKKRNNSQKGAPDITLAGIGFPTREVGVKYFYVPVGVLALAGFIETRGYTAKILDYQVWKYDDKYAPESFRDFFRQAKSDVLGVSVMAKDMPFTLLGLEMLKKERPEMIIIMGGAGPTGIAKGLMEKFTYVDYVVMGEGEHTLAELMDYIKNGGDPSKIKGLAWRKNGGVVLNKRRERITDLDSLPRPAYHLIRKNRYNFIYMPGARGCSHFCTFCDQAALWQGCEVKRSIGNLLDEIQYIRKELEAPWGMAFSDNEFCSDPERFERFAEEIKKRRIFFPFSMDRRIDNVDDESLKKAVSVGCRLILYGIESASGHVLKEIRKAYTPEKIIPGLLLSANHIDCSVASFIFNFPFETLGDFLETISTLYKLANKTTDNLISLQLHYLSPLPRTPIFAKYKDRLVRRNVSSIITSRVNEETYDLVENSVKKKLLVLPRILEGEIDEDPRVKKMVEESPLLFPSYYCYESPHMELKEKIISLIKACLPRDFVNMIFQHDDKMIYVGKDFITVAGDSPDMPAVIRKIGLEEMENADEAIEGIIGMNKKHYLLAFEMEGCNENKETGRKILALLRGLREKGATITLLSHVPKQYFSFMDGIRAVREFSMPRSDEEAADVFYVDPDGMVKSPHGWKGSHISLYRSREALYRAITRQKGALPGGIAKEI